MKSVVAVYDSKAGCYGDPIFAETDAVAIRSFANVVAQPGHQFNMNPEDFRLHKLGDFDPINGIFELAPAPTELAFAGAMVAPSNVTAIKETA